MSQNSNAQLGRLFSFGMPKCGTTTLASMLNTHPAISVHNQKEPEDFLKEHPKLRLSGYKVTEQTRWLTDFSTRYGQTENRNIFFDGQRYAGLQPELSRYVICVRDPADLARSYVKHVAERIHQFDANNIGSLRSEILSISDIDGALRFLVENVDPDHVFVVHFSTLTNPEKQPALADALFDWLKLETQNSSEAIWANASGSAENYPAHLEKLAMLVRRTSLVRSLSPQRRSQIRRLFSQPALKKQLSNTEVEELIAWLDNQESVIKTRRVLKLIPDGALTPAISEHFSK